ncbi:MAG: DegT/DnrJ/EryC1/StrS aminotransferase family protein, partial [Leptospiraceae bacterium]|nr:DegT/DnrJ/EryC1/StrS aminotransferase family protein [Leptospiraceae bacterium]
MQPQVTNLHPSSKNHRIEYDKPTISKGELKTVLECLVEDQLYTGSIVERFEKEFRSTFQFKYSLSVNSLFAAYHLSLLALGVKAGDRVLLSSFAPLQALDALFLIGAEPVPLELGKSSFHPSPEDLQKKIKEKEPKAIILDHTFGCLLNFKNYDLANIPVIEDYSEALGADLEEIPVGKQGTLSICGLAENHVITTGNGAMISSNDANLHNFMKNLRFNPTAPRKDRSPRFEYNLIDYQAAMGIEQLSKLGLIIERKKKIAQVYLQAVMAASHETYFQKAAA